MMQQDKGEAYVVQEVEHLSPRTRHAIVEKGDCSHQPHESVGFHHGSPGIHVDAVQKGGHLVE